MLLQGRVVLPGLLRLFGGRHLLSKSEEQGINREPWEFIWKATVLAGFNVIDRPLSLNIREYFNAVVRVATGVAGHRRPPEGDV